MCGIFGYVGNKDDGAKKILDGVHLLEYRGYDSMGVALLVDGTVKLYKISDESAKKDAGITDVSAQVDFSAYDLPVEDYDMQNCRIGIGHTRWATCGGRTTANAHPHHDQAKKIFLVHNGNVENFDRLKKKHFPEAVFYSETDTELIANLVAKHYSDFDLEKAMRLAMDELEGANVILVMCHDFPDKLFAIKRQGTLILGKNGDGSFVSSDMAALESIGIEATRILEDGEFAVIIDRGWGINSKVKSRIELTKQKEDSLNGYSYFMEKEIWEQPESLKRAISGRLDPNLGVPCLGGIKDVARSLRKVETFHFVGCGTAYYACHIASKLFNRFNIKARPWVASEFIYNHPVFNPTDAFVFISQSGETADTIEVLTEIKFKGNLCLGLVNAPGSRIARETDAGIMLRAGTERGVASTKAFTSMLSVATMLAMFIARQRNMTIDTGQRIIRELEAIPSKVQKIIESANAIEELAGKYYGFPNWYFLGRGFSHITAMEGALKLKEISYIHAEGYPLGDMKHGPLALVDPNFVSVVVIPRDSLFDKSVVNIREIKGRGGKVIAVTNPKVDPSGLVDDIIEVPETFDYLSPFLTVIPLQLLAYYTALKLGRNPDKPRNLAKSVTVS